MQYDNEGIHSANTASTIDHGTMVFNAYNVCTLLQKKCIKLKCDILYAIQYTK